MGVGAAPNPINNLIPHLMCQSCKFLKPYLFISHVCSSYFIIKYITIIILMSYVSWK